MREPIVIAHRTEKCIVCNVVWLQNQTVLSCFHKYIVSKRKEVTNYLYMTLLSVCLPGILHAVIAV